MLNFYVNRAGKNLTATRRKELAKAKKLLSQKIRRSAQKTSERAA
jgi:hypothetical protein